MDWLWQLEMEKPYTALLLMGYSTIAVCNFIALVVMNCRANFPYFSLDGNLLTPLQQGLLWPFAFVSAYRYHCRRRELRENAAVAIGVRRSRRGRRKAKKNPEPVEPEELDPERFAAETEPPHLA